MSTPDSRSPTSANDDESTRIHIAVRALDDMRSRVSVPNSGEIRATRNRSRDAEQDESQQKPTRDFVSRMSLFPLVGTALRAYEQGKASSRVVKYGAQMVESGMKTISKPVIDRLPVNQIDEFACRQLDRLDKYRRPLDGPELPESPVSPRTTNKPLSHVIDAGPSSISFDRGRSKLRAKIQDGSPDGIARMEHHEGTFDRWEYIDTTCPSARAVDSGTASPIGNSRVGSPMMTEDRRTSASDHSHGHQVSHLRHRHSNGDTQGPEQDSQDTERQVVQRSIWQAVLLEAGGLGVALSDENIRRLKYCLNWLLCATAHIDAQILILRDLIESIQPLPRTNSVNSRRPPISEEHLRKLTEVRKDIVTTVRQMVDVVSKCAGGALPEPAKSRVRSFILKLPQRWASRTAATGAGSTSTSGSAGEWERETIAAAGSNMGSLRRGQGRDRRAVQRERGTGSRAPSPSSSDSHARSLHSGQNSTVASQQLTQSNAAGAARRILTLATESLDMMRNVTGVVKDSLDRADAWVNRLRMVGVQRGGQEGSSGSDEILNDETLNEDFRLPGNGLHYHAESTSRADYQVPPQTHRSSASIASSISVGRGEDSSSSSVPVSPFTTAATLSHGTSFMSTSSYTTGSMSTPSTPTGTSFTSLPVSSVSIRDMYCGTVTNVSSPGAIPLADMHIASRLNTPKIGVLELSAEDEVLIENGKEEQVMSLKRLDMTLEMEVDES